jgi:glycosyltransferase involved in cell wall biosynthesis
MKVLFVTREYPPFEVGGIAVHTFNLVKNIAKLGVSCKVLSFGDEMFSSQDVKFVTPSSSIIERGNVSLALNSRIPIDIMRFSRIANQLLKHEHFDVVHVEEPYVGALVFPNAHQVKVTTFHTTSFGEVKAMIGNSLGSYGVKRALFYSSLGIYLELMGISSSTSLIVPTQQVADELYKVYRTSKGKVQIIQNGVDLPELDKTDGKANAKQKLGLSPEIVLILSVGRLVGRKHVDLLVKAAKKLQVEKLNQYRIVIVGEGPELSNIVRLVKEYDLQSIVELPGRISDEQRDLYYRAVDIFVLTSNYEGFPITMLEAMSYGAAVITSRIKSVSGLREGLDSLMFPAGDSYALSVCLKTLLINPLLRTRLSASARIFAEKHSWQKIAEETLKVYKTLFNPKNKLSV